MADVDPFKTQRHAGPAVAAELRAAGFQDAEEIGRGGFGVVYRCTQATLDRTVAVKVLAVDFDEDNRARFFREQRAMGRLTGHPNIVEALQVGATESGLPFIVMQYHERGSLDALIRRNGPLSLEDVLRLGVKLAGALETAHLLGILHRDVKPANIMLTEYGEPALTDFGIAHLAGGFQTATGVVTGSPAFTAPEVLGGQAPSTASDIYGLGATLFCAITGHAAFERRSGEQLVAQFVRIASQPIPDLRDNGIADDLSAVVERAMSGDPGDRPSATQLGNALREAQRHHGLPVDEMALPGQSVGGVQRAPQGTSTPRLKGNLPLELTSFVGRRRELAEAKNSLTSSRLVTLTGIGGVGKTRIALRLATMTERNFKDGVWLAELGELRDESLLVDVVAAALGLRDRTARRLDELIVDYLASRDLLLVLDNCEQLVGAVAELSETLLRTCPRLRILATSREAFGIDGEAVLRVPPMTVPDREPSLQGMPRYDAVTLFAQRAATAVPTFVLTDDNRVVVARICQRLDGLPLPIELAAARLRAMSPEQILQRLTDRYALLTRRSRGTPPRQQTLRLCIDWSYGLCTPQEQLVWSRLSVFAGSFELDAAEKVCGGGLDPENVLDVLTSLVDKSILIREEQGIVVQFRLLETLRDYGREEAQRNGDYPELRRRHRDWYQQLALDAEAEWISSRQLVWIARFEREQPNLREALEFCLSEPDNSDIEVGLRIGAALYLYWSARGLHTEGRHWLDRLLARNAGQATAARIKALYTNSVMAEVQGDFHTGAALVAEGRALAEQISDPVTKAYVDHAEGLLALFSGEHAHACSRLKDALVVFRTAGELTLQVEALEMLGLACDSLNETAQALNYYEEVLAITKARGESVYRSYTSWAMGVALWRQGSSSRAVGLLEEGLRLARHADEPLGSAVCIEALAWIAASNGSAKRAVVLMGAAQTLQQVAGSTPAFLPHLLIHHEESERTARRALGERAFHSAYREGRALNSDAAFAYALNEQVSSPAPLTRMQVTLTKRERQVADLVAEGLTNKAIASHLVISQRTVEGHVEHVLAKLGFTSRAQIAAWVVEQAQLS
ncbi:protein kinase domain-containing protein [Rhodococcus daqingensis]|uniref:Protein kinase n=1 Tax=Rhodococcus daqingensis TaxID=2479363 RepID=A0ABW2S4V2_9NOCA